MSGSGTGVDLVSPDSTSWDIVTGMVSIGTGTLSSSAEDGIGEDAAQGWWGLSREDFLTRSL